LEALTRLGLQRGISFDLDFHTILFHGEDALVQKHYVSKRSRRQKGILAFLAQDAATRVFGYVNNRVRQDVVSVGAWLWSLVTMRSIRRDCSSPTDNARGDVIAPHFRTRFDLRSVSMSGQALPDGTDRSDSTSVALVSSIRGADDWRPKSLSKTACTAELAKVKSETLWRFQKLRTS
jgi:hypothetical protein